jgi:hypothetical protein
MSVAILTWTPPQTRLKGAPLTAEEIDHTEIFDSQSATPLLPIATVPGSEATFTTGELAEGTHDFTVVVVDVYGHRSAPTKATSLVAGPGALALPEPASNLTAILKGPPAPVKKPAASPARPLFGGPAPAVPPKPVVPPPEEVK